MKHKHLEHRTRQLDAILFIYLVFLILQRSLKEKTLSWKLALACSWSERRRGRRRPSVRWDPVLSGEWCVEVCFNRCTQTRSDARCRYSVLQQTHPSRATHLEGGGADVDPGLLPSGWHLHHMWMYCGDGALNMDLCLGFNSFIFGSSFLWAQSRSTNVDFYLLYYRSSIPAWSWRWK